MKTLAGLVVLILVSGIPAAATWVAGANRGLVALALALPVAVPLGALAFYAPRSLFRRVGITVSALAVFCFAATLAEEFLLGGTPLNGKVVEEDFYVGSHGRYREVSPTTFRFALVFNVGAVALWPAMFVFAILNDRLGEARDGARRSLRRPGA
jgi:hypothetical protein